MPINKHLVIISSLAILLIAGLAWAINNSTTHNSKENDSDNVASHTNNPAVLSLEDQVTPTNHWHETEAFATTTTTPTSSQQTKPQTQNLSIAFIDLPQQVKAGEKFDVTWHVTGPAGMQGEDTKLEVTYEVQSSSNNSTASSSSRSSQSFGSFVTPQKFDSTISFGNTPGTINLKITARINGQILSAVDSVTLTQ